MKISEMSIRRPVMTTLLTATIIALGVFGYRLLPVSALPKVDFPTIQITATLARREPRHHGGVGGRSDRAPAVDGRRHFVDDIAVLSRARRRSPSSSTSIATSMRAALDVQTALTIAQRRLPVEMTTPPSFRKVNPSDFPVLFMALSSATLAALDGA